MKTDHADTLRELGDARVAARLSAETIAAQQAEMRRLEGEVAQRDRTIDALRHAMPIVDMPLATARLIVAAGAALDYFTDKTDITDTGHGNRESDLAQELSEAIRKAKGER
jgi:hypothetical protein